MKTYQFEFIAAEYEEFEMPEKAEHFVIEANGIAEAVRKADKHLHNWGVTLNLNDYNDYEYDEETWESSDYEIIETE